MRFMTIAKIIKKKLLNVHHQPLHQKSQPLEMNVTSENPRQKRTAFCSEIKVENSKNPKAFHCWRSCGAASNNKKTPNRFTFFVSLNFVPSLTHKDLPVSSSSSAFSLVVCCCVSSSDAEIVVVVVVCLPTSTDFKKLHKFSIFVLLCFPPHHYVSLCRLWRFRHLWTLLKFLKTASQPDELIRICCFCFLFVCKDFKAKTKNRKMTSNKRKAKKQEMVPGRWRWWWLVGWLQNIQAMFVSELHKKSPAYKKSLQKNEIKQGTQ